MKTSVFFATAVKYASRSFSSAGMRSHVGAPGPGAGRRTRSPASCPSAPPPEPRPAGTLYTIGPAAVCYAASPTRRGGAMAKIKHIALSTQDPEATAKFYVDVFGMKQVGR